MKTWQFLLAHRVLNSGQDETGSRHVDEDHDAPVRTTITIPEISERLGICEETVYDMLRGKTIPNIRYGRRFIISRVAYERWEATIGETVSPSVAKVPGTIQANASPSSRQSRPPKAA